MTEQQQVQDEPVRKWVITQWGGGNYRDQADELVARSHAVDGAGNWVPRPGFLAESPELQNEEFFGGSGRGKRLGSATFSNLTTSSVFLSGDVVVDGWEFDIATTGAVVIYVVSKKTVYFSSDSGSTWVQCTGPWSSAYTHSDQTVTLASADMVGGHIVIGIDGANAKLVARGTSTLDDLLRNDITTTTVDTDSNSAQTVLSVAATTMFMVNDRVRINSGGARDESGYIASISAGVSITLQANLTYTHTAVQADVVEVANRWTDTYRSNTTHVVTGAWTETGTYMVAACNDRLFWCNGNTLVLGSPRASGGSSIGASGVWDAVNSIAYEAEGRVIALKSLVPIGGDETLQQLAVFTANGPTLTTGFSQQDQPQQRRLDCTPMNHRCVAATRNWLVVLTRDFRILAYNGFRVFDLGERMRNISGTGPSQEWSYSDSSTTAFTKYDPRLQRVYCCASTASGRVNDLWIVVDMRLGEPGYQEAEPQAEGRIRLVPWRITNPDTNDWFGGMILAGRGMIGWTQAGYFYDMSTGKNDLDSIAIETHYFTAQFHAGQPTSGKEFLHALIRSEPKGDWDVTVDHYFDRSQSVGQSWTFRQIPAGAAVYGTAVYDVDTYTDGRQARAGKDTSRYREVIQIDSYNGNANEDFIILSLEQPFLYGAMNR